LKQELIHPDRTSSLVGLRFSPDGKRVIAGSDPGGVFVVWDTATGKELTTIETGSRRLIDDRFKLSPDWRTLFVARTSQKAERVDKDGKHAYRFEFDGGLKSWDLTTGRPVRTFKHEPPRFVLQTEVSPDGYRIATLEWLSGTYEGRPPRAASLWDLRTGNSYPFPDGVDWHPTFSPDGRTLAINASGGDRFVHAVKLFDTATRKEKLSIPIPEPNALGVFARFSPDGKLLAGGYGVYPRGLRGGESQSFLKCWDIATGEEVAAFASDRGDPWLWNDFSPDAKILAAINWNGEKAKVFLFRVADKTLIKTVVLGDKKKDETLNTRIPAFSADGKWLAVITQAVPDGENRDPRDLAQPRIHLIEAATGEILQTLISPQAIAMSAGFSPDGKTLATGGYGRVLLWDITGLGSASAKASGR
jgi:WD40 repeat protein